jgi:hypothetical protein
MVQADSAQVGSQVTTCPSGARARVARDQLWASDGSDPGRAAVALPVRGSYLAESSIAATARHPARATRRTRSSVHRSHDADPLSSRSSGHSGHTPEHPYRAFDAPTAAFPYAVEIVQHRETNRLYRQKILFRRESF